MKSETKLEKQLEKKLTENPDSDVAQEGLETVRAALEKTKKTIKEDPAKEWDAAKDAKVAEAKKTIAVLEDKVEKKRAVEEAVRTTVDERAGLIKKPTAAEKEAVVEEASN